MAHIFNLSNRYWNIMAPGLQLDDYEVCRLLSPMVFAAANAIEICDLLVSRIEVTPEYVRAYPDLKGVHEGKVGVMPTFVQKDLPRGLYAACLDNSAGPPRPFPPTAEEIASRKLLSKLEPVAFRKPSKYMVMSSEMYWMLRAGSKNLDVNCQRDQLMRGFFGTLHATGNPERQIQIWVSRDVPQGSVVVTDALNTSGKPDTTAGDSHTLDL